MLTMAGNLTHREEQTVECLEVRNAAYQLLVDFIGEEPTLENIVAWRNHSIWGQLSSMSEGAREVCKRLQEVPLLELYNLLSSMRVEYERLFQPGGELPVTPCESMYRAHEQMLPKSYAQEVREDYADFSIYFKKMQGESDDHIAVELEFMTVIIGKMHNTLMTEERYERYINGQSRFIQDHLQHWVIRFGQDLEQYSTHPLYKAIGMMLQDFIAKEAAWARETAH